MTNSDAFAPVHNARASKLRKQLETAQLQLAAVLADLDDMLSANRVDELAPGSGLAGGGRSSDVSDPTANTALRWDSNAEKWGAYFGGIAQTITGMRDATWATQLTLRNPTPTGLCRHGDCPEKLVATRGVKARDGLPRCEACYKFWLRDVVSPDLETVHGSEWKRREREEKFQSPRWLGFPKQGQVA